MPECRTRKNHFKLRQPRFRLDIRKSFLTVRATRQWDPLPGEVSVLTTLERRFNLQSADVGVIASSFEIGNLALILFVSYFGARGHRPRLIGCGGIVMALGALLSALPEFLTHQYKYESGEIRWGTGGRDVCVINESASDEGPDPDRICRSRTATNMMYLLLIGAQVLLGIGATPVQPLGVSYIDDHVRRKDSSLYIDSQQPWSWHFLQLYKMKYKFDSFLFLSSRSQRRLEAETIGCSLRNLLSEPTDTLSGGWLALAATEIMQTFSPATCLLASSCRERKTLAQILVVSCVDVDSERVPEPGYFFDSSRGSVCACSHIRGPV
ncbi:Solute carrier organic anion transporter family member 3A1 [Varanus komodoensis]|nr:Solute carrier organic anion transporter family member 3A1 [Varanus komodoensis]